MAASPLEASHWLPVRIACGAGNGNGKPIYAFEWEAHHLLAAAVVCESAFMSRSLCTCLAGISNAADFLHIGLHASMSTTGGLRRITRHFLSQGARLRMTQ